MKNFTKHVQFKGRISGLGGFQAVNKIKNIKNQVISIKVEEGGESI